MDAIWDTQYIYSCIVNVPVTIEFPLPIHSHELISPEPKTSPTAASDHGSRPDGLWQPFRGSPAGGA